MYSFSINVFSILITIAGFAILLVIFLKKISTINKRLDRHRQDIDQAQSPQSVPSSNDNRIRDIEEDIKKLYDKYNALQDKEVSVETEDKNDNGKNVVSENINKEQVIFYLPLPDREGNFNDASESKEFKPSESVYKFTTNDIDHYVAYFSFVNDQQTMNRAIWSPETYLEPVCENDNPYNSNASYIKTIKQGKSTKTENKWVVEEKAIIRYE